MAAQRSRLDGIRPPVAQRAAASPNRTGLPDGLKAGVESLSGMSMDHVQVHYNSSRPAEVGALAYARGSEIHMAPGQERHLPHEAWHLVQQQQGRVQPTMQAHGVAINDDARLEHEAESMGARALRGPAPMQRVSSSAREGDVSLQRVERTGGGVIQRAVGLEIESSPDWQAYDHDRKLASGEKVNHLVTGENRTLYEEAGFRLETELSGKLEFVIEPAVETTQELVAIVQRIQRVVQQILRAQTGESEGYDPFTLPRLVKMYGMSEQEILKKKEFRRAVYKPVQLLSLAKAVKGAADVLISRGPGEFHGGFQATVGVHLSAIPALFRLLKDDFTSYPSLTERDSAQEAAATARKRTTGLPLTWYRSMSPEMEGLLTLVYYYLFAGASQRERRPFPKGITQVMARTNFAQMFAMTPEAEFLSSNADWWVRLVTDAAKLAPDERIFPGTFGDTDADATVVDVTRRQWLTAMIGTSKAKGVDRLSVDGGGPALLKTMGSMTKTDSLGVAGDANRGVIVELRGLDAATYPVSQWDGFARRISEAVLALNERQPDRQRLAANQQVANEGRGASLSWSPYRSDQEAGKDVYGMAVEAYRAPFRQQVQGLIVRARERAEMADAERT